MIIRYAEDSAPQPPATIDTASARLPASYEAAKQALANCEQIDECVTWADKAAALASYAKQAKDEELMRRAARIRDRAIRRAGELLNQIEPAPGANQNITAGGGPKVLTRKDAGEAAGMSERQIKTAIRVANVPADDFEMQVESPNPPTVSKLAAQGTKPAPKPIIDLKGRDPEEFNRSLHFVGEIEGYCRDIQKKDLGQILPGLVDTERDRLRNAIAAIDAVHDSIVTRI